MAIKGKSLTKADLDSYEKISIGKRPRVRVAKIVVRNPGSLSTRRCHAVPNIYGGHAYKLRKKNVAGVASHPVFCAQK